MNEEVHIIDELRRALSNAKELEGITKALGGVLVEKALAEKVFLHLELKNGTATAAVRTLSYPNLTGDGLRIELAHGCPVSLGQKISGPLFISDSSKARFATDFLLELARQEVKSLALLPLYRDGNVSGILEVRFEKSYRRFTHEDAQLLSLVADYVGLHLANLRATGQEGEPAGNGRKHLMDEMLGQYQRLARFGNLLIVRTDPDLVVKEVLGESEEIIGLSAAEMTNSRGAWFRFVHPADLRRLLLKIRRERPAELSEEIRIINQRTGLTHWLLLRAVPLINDKNQLSGWEGYGVDISDRHHAQEELLHQGKRIEALYAVSRSLQTSADPALVTLKGLNALVNATRSDCGVGYFMESSGERMEIVASVGLSKSCVADLGRAEVAESLLAHVLLEKKGLLVDDLQNESHGLGNIAREEGLRSAILMPLVFEDRTMGVLVLFRRRNNRYSSADFDLIAAASSQISLAAREAELYVAEKRQSSSLGALYRLSHQLSRQITLKEVIQNSFAVIQDEFACKRMWLGVINDQGTHIAGQAGYGPGVRKHIIDIQIELSLRHDFLDEALEKKQPVIIEAGRKMECSGLNRLIKQLEVGTIIVVPLVTLGQVVGVLVIEPAIPAVAFAQSKLPLLNSMASEIAPVILARRLEARMSDAAKMRMASMLASGIAHNFNNLLQAVMGQASLIEMQTPADSKARESAHMILEAASKGASLVKQLFSLSADAPYSPRPFGAAQLLEDSRDLYRSVLGSKIDIEYDFEEDCGEIMGDYSSVQQVMTNLLLNAKDALADRTDGKVSVTVRKVRLRSGEVDPELAPGLYLRIDVTDNGIGMDEEKVARCFEPFFTTKNIDSRTGLGLGGAGLGLSSAYSIMKKHDGLITVRSQPSQGATFSLYFPAVTVHASGNPDLEEAGREDEQGQGYHAEHTPSAANAPQRRPDQGKRGGK